MSRNATIDIELMIHAETSLAILVSDNGEEDTAVWLPKSQIDYDNRAHEGDITSITVPEWLAIRGGLG